MQHIGLSVILLLTAASVSSTNLFFYCFFGMVATESYEKMAECIYESDWTELPVKLQKYILLMIGNAHRPLYYDGFGLAILRLQTFQNVKR